MVNLPAGLLEEAQGLSWSKEQVSGEKSGTWVVDMPSFLRAVGLAFDLDRECANHGTDEYQSSSSWTAALTGRGTVSSSRIQGGCVSGQRAWELRASVP
jgi:hypothetical protein